MYCVFRLGEYQLGVEASRVREVARPAAITPVAGAPQGVSGVVALRGEIITALDLRRWFGLPPAASEPAAMVVLRGTAEPVCVLADQVCDVLVLDSSEREPVPTTLENSASAVITGAHQADGEVVLELDPGALLTSVATDDRTETR